jgi:hypothetical protein
VCPVSFALALLRRMKCAIALALLVAVAVAHAADDPKKASCKWDKWCDSEVGHTGPGHFSTNTGAHHTHTGQPANTEYYKDHKYVNPGENAACTDRWHQ